jgi:Holliday junction resolvase
MTLPTPAQRVARNRRRGIAGERRDRVWLEEHGYGPARRVTASGSGTTKGDLRTARLVLDRKSTTAGSYRLREEDLLKATSWGRVGQVGAMLIAFGGSRRRWLVLDADDAAREFDMRGEEAPDGGPS